jgi:YbgC/YbaW family acyl-CoA thioester hydrolase
MLEHRQNITIRFSDADPAGVVFYPRALALAHEVTEDMIRRSGLGGDGWFAAAEHAAPVRRAEAEFFSPMRPGETFAARAAVEKLGETSVTFVVEFTDQAGRTAARIRTVHVLINRATGRPQALTAAVRAAFGA